MNQTYTSPKSNHYVMIPNESDVANASEQIKKYQQECNNTRLDNKQDVIFLFDNIICNIDIN